MTSSVTWLDHDGAAHERAMELLALFWEKESRDELGIGGIRDSIADRLFPGTSTIQTRLRYMCFIPWLYAGLEQRQRSARVFTVEARDAETALRNELIRSEKSGVIGRDAGATLKRMPSSIYWAGLGAWGLRRSQGSQREYHGGIDRLYARRTSRRRQGDAEWDEDDHSETWHHQLLALQPEGFPAGATFSLTNAEADLLIECLQRHQRGSLLAFLAVQTVASKEKTACGAPWQHPNFAAFPQEHREFLGQARIFSFLHKGAALLYNLLLAEVRAQGMTSEQLAQSPPEVLAESYRNTLTEWVDDPEFGDLAAWSPRAFWQEVVGRGHSIRQETREFVETWWRLVVREGNALSDSPESRALIRAREIQLKRLQSRFTNSRALEQWGGNAGTGRLVYRWFTAQSFLNDLQEALRK
jgi:hypothetical protein